MIGRVQRAAPRVVATLLLVLSAACHHRTAATMSGTAADSSQGVVSVVGTAFDQRLMMQREGDARPTRLRPANSVDSASLARLAGVEVIVRGSRSDDGFHVSNFTATRVGALPVVDGVLRLDGSRVVLETATGRMTLSNPPDALRNMIGARVWISGSPATGPNSYGIIVPAR